jgi:DNA polymerase elongation subunit (family B)
MNLMEDAKRELRIGRVPLDELVIRQRLSRTIEAYKTPSPAAHAARQLQAYGRQFAPGQSLEFLFARNATGVHAWELEDALDSGKLDTKRYYRLLDRAMQTILDPSKPFCVLEELSLIH